MLRKLGGRIRKSSALKFSILSSPPFFFLLIFFAAPLVIVVAYSFGVIDELRRLTLDFTTRFYATFFFSGPILTVFGRSLYIATSTTVITLILGYPAAYHISTKAGRYKDALLLMVIIPFWISFLLRTYSLMIILREDGVVSAVLLRLGIISEPINLLFTQTSVIIGMVYNYLPFMILPLYASIEKIDRRVLEAAQTLGANPVRTFFSVTLPLTFPGVLAGSLLVFIPAVGEFIIPALLGGTESLMIGNLIFNFFLGGGGATLWPLGSAVSIILIVLVLFSILAYTKLARQRLELVA